MPLKLSQRRRRKLQKKKPQDKIPDQIRDESPVQEQQREQIPEEPIIDEQSEEAIMQEQSEEEISVQEQGLIQNDDQDEYQDHKSWWYILEGIVGCFSFTMLIYLLLIGLVKVKLDEKVIKGLIFICLTTYGLIRYFRKVAPLAYVGGIACFLFLFYPSAGPTTYYYYFVILYEFLHTVTNVQNILILCSSIWFGCFFLPNAIYGHHFGYSTKTCAVIYMIGIIYCLCIVYPFKSTTMKPVPNKWKSTFNDTSISGQYFKEMRCLAYTYSNDSIKPYKFKTWIIEKMKEVGLDVYTHNFTYHIPLNGKEDVVHGKNIYGILRCPRSTSTQSMVLSIPFKMLPIQSVDKFVAPVATMLAFANFAKKKKYWNKDIIFLVPDRGGLGVQAWLEAYHGVTMSTPGVIDNGVLKERAGRIVAAINLELEHGMSSRVDIKVDGLNGKLPNLDLVNLAVTMLKRNRIPRNFKHEYYLQPHTLERPISDIFYWCIAFRTALAMVSGQATGIPDGEHGFFNVFGINAITLKGGVLSKSKLRQVKPFVNIGKLLDGMFKSIDNLENGFSNNTYFYLLTSPHTFISYGVYFPSVCILIGTLFYKAFVIFDQLVINIAEENRGKRRNEPRPGILPADNSRSLEDRYKEILQTVEPAHSDPIDIFSIMYTCLITTAIGFAMRYTPQLIIEFGKLFDLLEVDSLFYASMVVPCVSSIIPFLVPLRRSERNMTLLNVFLLLILGSALFSIAFLNFSLALYGAVIYVPIALILSHKFTEHTFIASGMKFLVWITAHPLVVHIWITMLYVYMADLQDWNEPYFKYKFFYGLALIKNNMRDCIDFAMMFNHYHFNIITCVFIPIWLGLGIIVFK